MQTSSVATLYLNPNGTPIVAHWLDWKCDGELRWLGRDGSRVLQQQWYRDGTDTIGSICTTEHEWRDVPFTVQ